jgi:hypothetical protein
MPITTIRTPPSAEDFTPLAVYESSTPESFVDGKPILHFEVRNVQAAVPRSQRGRLTIFPDDATATAEASDDASDDLVEQKVDVFVNSAYVSSKQLPVSGNGLIRIKSLAILPFSLYRQSKVWRSPTRASPFMPSSRSARRRPCGCS